MRAADEREADLPAADERGTGSRAADERGADLPTADERGADLPDLAAEFEAERGHLTAVAYRMLGSRADAEDAVQDTWLRYAAALADPRSRAEIRDLSAWLTTTTARLCLDVLRSARVRRAAYPGQWLPEPIVSRLADPPGSAGGFAPDPAERATRTDEIGIALLAVLERLSPEQRVAFVLHDVFTVPFEQIATVLAVTPEAARQLASRGRRAATAGTPQHTADRAEQRRVVRAFLAAADSGDLDRLVAVLAPGVIFVGDSGGHFPNTRNPILGPVPVARFTLGLLRRSVWEIRTMRAQPVLVDGLLGMQVEADWQDGRPVRMIVWFTVADGRLTGIFNQFNPEKVTRVPALDPGAGDWPPRF